MQGGSTYLLEKLAREAEMLRAATASMFLSSVPFASYATDQLRSDLASFLAAVTASTQRRLGLETIQSTERLATTDRATIATSNVHLSTSPQIASSSSTNVGESTENANSAHPPAVPSLLPVSQNDLNRQSTTVLSAEMHSSRSAFSRVSTGSTDRLAAGAASISSSGRLGTSPLQGQGASPKGHQQTDSITQTPGTAPTFNSAVISLPSTMRPVSDPSRSPPPPASALPVVAIRLSPPSIAGSPAGQPSPHFTESKSLTSKQPDAPALEPDVHSTGSHKEPAPAAPSIALVADTPPTRQSDVETNTLFSDHAIAPLSVGLSDPPSAGPLHLDPAQDSKEFAVDTLLSPVGTTVVIATSVPTVSPPSQRTSSAERVRDFREKGIQPHASHGGVSTTPIRPEYSPRSSLLVVSPAVPASASAGDETDSPSAVLSQSDNEQDLEISRAIAEEPDEPEPSVTMHSVTLHSTSLPDQYHPGADSARPSRHAGNGGSNAGLGLGDSAFQISSAPDRTASPSVGPSVSEFVFDFAPSAVVLPPSAGQPPP